MTSEHRVPAVTVQTLCNFSDMNIIPSPHCICRALQGAPGDGAPPEPVQGRLVLSHLVSHWKTIAVRYKFATLQTHIRQENGKRELRSIVAVSRGDERTADSVSVEFHASHVQLIVPEGGCVSDRRHGHLNKCSRHIW